MEELIDCVIVTKSGYFDHVKVKSDDVEKYSYFIIGETANGYKKIKFPEQTSYIKTNGVLGSVGKANQEMVRRLEKAAKEKSSRIKEIQQRYSMETVVKEEAKQKEIVLDDTLEQANPYERVIKPSMHSIQDEDARTDEEKIKEHQEEKKERFNSTIIDKSNESNLVTVRDCVYGEFRHLNYLEYLSFAWKNHIGIVFTPDFLWQIFLTEVATHIKDNAEKYRELFTDSDEKKKIVVPTGDPQLIDLRLIADELLKLTPTDTEMFLPEFSTTTFQASMAFKAAFADAMSPYYDYSMFMCGIPKVKVFGDDDDWDKVIENIKSFGEVIALPDYFQRAEELVVKIKNAANDSNSDFWKDMFRLDRCGSGGQVEVKGWINDLYIKVPNPGYINNYPSATSYVKYKFLETDQDFELCYGLFSSNIEGGYLLPEFGYIINEIK